MSYTQEVLESLKQKYYWEKVFLQAAEDVLGSLNVLLERRPRYRKYALFERLVEPERVILFRVPWMDDQNRIRVNSGSRVEFNSALGPYKGGVISIPRARATRRSCVSARVS